MDDNDLFSTETINVPIGFRLFAIAQLSLSENYSAKWDHNFKEEWMDKCQPTCTHDWHLPPPPQQDLTTFLPHILVAWILCILTQRPNLNKLETRLPGNSPSQI